MDAILKASLPKLREKLLEALQAVLPIVAIVLVLCFTIAPVSPSILLCFLLGAVLIVVGIMFFTLGAEMSMTPMGERVGAVLTRSRKLPVILGVGFLLGFLITISEPDLQVLANQVPSIPNQTLIFSVAAGVGLFLTVAFLRMLLGVALPPLLVAFYGLVFVLAAFVPREFLAVAFDSGGVTTGPMTVPFIMALGVGVSAIRGDRHAADDSFGLVALCSVGPILAVLILGIAFRASDSTYIPPVLPEVSDSVELWQLFHEGLPEYIKEIASSLLPIVVMFGVFQAVALRLDKRTLGRIAVGLAYTYVGLVLFLTGANVGFMPAGNYLGQVLTGQSYHWVIIPIGMLIGYFIVKAEPAVYVLNKQVEEVTDGAISAQAMGMALSAGVSISVGLAMVRVLTGISILWFLIPGYAVAIGISFVVPKLVESIQTFALNLGGYLANVQGWYNDIIAYFHLDVEALDLSGLNDVLKNLFNYVLGFLSDLGPHLLELTSGIVSMVVTGVLSLVFSIYMLSGRDTLMSQCRRVLRAYVPARFADPLTDVVHLTADTFTRFVTGQLIEACILGGLCAAGMLFIQADYAPLIGVIIGASAIIPVAGAYIGAIVSALPLVMVSPIKALVFLVFLVVLQQIEGNVIYPKVVGTSIGLPGIWVLAAVTIGGGVGGLVGVLLSVPVASVLYALLRRDVHKRLACKE